MIKKCTFIK